MDLKGGVIKSNTVVTSFVAITKYEHKSCQLEQLRFNGDIMGMFMQYHADFARVFLIPTSMGIKIYHWKKS